ncbi:sensor histidine kinase [Aquimarina brevivitae]|uniref:histidine kinase n=1 Tax=Aquimarina brevivitae TaxID=323412 RepID=A0A4V2F5D5_9FLAO|nr:ATP-binding protein [Aquimarina brevivitae]RZS92439.1 histidine kinase/DNA gyrase B/HSP90-like ATPase [Aquimarina brevivitae]
MLYILLLLFAVFAISFAILWVHHQRLNKQLVIDLAQKEKDLAKQTYLLELKNTELKQYNYLANHDFQEPLNTISCFVGLLREDYETNFDDSAKQSLTFIEEACDRMKNLMSDLNHYKVLGNQQKMEYVDTTQIVNDVLSKLSDDIKKYNAYIHCDTLPKIKAVPDEIRLLFEHLLSNALKFTDSQTEPRIHITSEMVINAYDEKLYQFSVTDNGFGISTQHQEKIFSIFQQLHPRGQYSGRGTGLAEAKKIVESHSGKMGLASEKGKGSTFYFTIPIPEMEKSPKNFNTKITENRYSTNV